MNTQLCWRCRKSTNSGCSWSKSLTPVAGWTAEPRPFKIPVDHKKNTYRIETTYDVTACPEFESDGDTTPLEDLLGDFAVKNCLLCYSRAVCEARGPICERVRVMKCHAK